VNDYFGQTDVNAGMLVLTGSLSATSGVAVKAGATFDVTGVPGGFTLGVGQILSGNGTVAGNLTVNGTVAPGESIGTLHFTNDLTLGGTADFEISKTGLTLGADLTAVSGALVYGGILNVVATGDRLRSGDRFNLFDAASFTGTFTSINLPPLDPGLSWSTESFPSDGVLVVIPEPYSIAALLSAAGMLLGVRRFRRPS
jgi:hypothetical protein